MKKLAIGCGIVILLCMIAGAGVGYYVYRKAQALYQQVAQFGQIPEIERGVRARGEYAPPASGELTKAQLERLIRVQTSVRQRLGQQFAAMEQKYKALAQKDNATIVDAPTLLAAYRDLAAAWLDAKRSQVDALNEAGLSLEEYRWIREQAYRALGVPYVDFDVSKLVDQIRSGASGSPEPGQLRGSFGPGGPESNRALIEPFKKQLEENLPLASFGL
ncbi:MAG TPA: hypothetical protein VH740_15900 [Vicinamibacterales bacterium]|jgi:hypothetical protein